MKKGIIALSVVVAVAAAGSALAQPGMGGMGPGMGGPMMEQRLLQGPYAAQYKKFLADTMPLREEMHQKHMALQREYIKDKPDTARIAKLQGELLQLRQQMYQARVKSGLPMGRMGAKGMMGGKRCGMGMGKGMGAGMGPMTPPPAPAQ